MTLDGMLVVILCIMVLMIPLLFWCGPDWGITGDSADKFLKDEE